MECQITPLQGPADRQPVYIEAFSLGLQWCAASILALCAARFHGRPSASSIQQLFKAIASAFFSVEKPFFYQNSREASSMSRHLRPDVWPAGRQRSSMEFPNRFSCQTQAFLTDITATCAKVVGFNGDIHGVSLSSSPHHERTSAIVITNSCANIIPQDE